MGTVAIPVLEAVAVGLGIFQTVNSIHTAKKTEKAVAAAVTAQTKSNAEQEKRLAAEQARQEALARAKAAASGLSGSSVDLYLNALSKVNDEEMDWLKQVGATKVAKISTEGSLAYNQALSNVFGAASNTATTAIRYYG